MVAYDRAALDWTTIQGGWMRYKHATWVTLGFLAVLIVSCPAVVSAESLATIQARTGHFVFLPTVLKPRTFEPIPGASYNALCMSCVSGWQPADRDADEHPDLNLAMRGWRETSRYRGLVSYNGGRDTNAPQLYGLFADERTPSISHVYQVYDWNWSTMERGDVISNWEVTLLGAATSPGEIIHVPRSGYRVGVDGGGSYAVMVLYATSSSVTLKFTREDNVVHGYTLHLDGLSVDPALVSLYKSCDASGRRSLPALRERQPFARAGGGELRVAIRDCGQFMDPRSRKDWWYGR